MEALSFRFTSYGFLLVCTFWSVTNCSTTAPSTTADMIPGTSAATAPPTTTPRPLEDVQEVTVVQSDTSVTVTFDKVDDISEYKLYFNVSAYVNCTAKNNSEQFQCTVDGLTPAREYTMTLRSVRGDDESVGYLFTARTAPENVGDFNQVNQNVSSITLEWTKKSDISDYILKFSEKEENFTTEDARYVVTNLSSSTEYHFTLYSVFKNIISTGANLTAYTAPSIVEGFKEVTQDETSITLEWKKADKDTISYVLSFNGTNQTFTSEMPATYTATDLQSSTMYNFTLVAVFANISGEAVTITKPTAPRDATVFMAQDQTETTITLQWDKVDDIPDYVLAYESKNVSINATSDTVVTHTVPNLQIGTLYTFTLYTKFEHVSSRGILHQAATAPPPVFEVEVTDRTLNTITLQWDNVQDQSEYLLDINGKREPVIPNAESISYTVKSLKPGTVYPFNITTIFKPSHTIATHSTLFQDSSVTVIDCAAVDWRFTTTSIHASVDGAFTHATASNGTQDHDSSGSSSEVNFTGLYPGATYDIRLMYDRLLQCVQTITIIPPSLTALCKNWDGGYSIYIEWDRPSGVWDSVEVTVSDQVHLVGLKGELHAVIPNFQPAKKYKVSISSRSGSETSSPYVFTCATDARGVIAGAFFGVLLFVILVCAVVFIMLRRRKNDIMSRWKKSPMGGARTSVRKSKRIPLEKFPAHFNELSADENKGFSLEYEDLSTVGTEQTQKAATVQENKPKNRFINVLPYDRSRVKLSSSTPHSDYINASYMPGYNSDREFIAAQGPMPSTVSDFWRMIWEQRVSAVVMVTNCTEGGRTKCEQYWPDSSDPRICGDLAVFTTSEQKQPNWTLREFKVKHRRTSEERTVKHFHFTAWPDHGVPEGTEVLIQFRTLVRRHMQTEAAGAPTVVHCSAGVGRTGTIIALDTLLQQMDKEKAVDINGFVYKMRLNRPHMVQTESQYVFLHQCILESLQLNDKYEENIYENELIYANATALKEYQNNMYKA